MAQSILKMFMEPTKTHISLTDDGTSKQFAGGPGAASDR